MSRSQDMLISKIIKRTACSVGVREYHSREGRVLDVRVATGAVGPALPIYPSQLPSVRPGQCPLHSSFHRG